MATWKIEGQYMETCNCTFLCPCLPSNLTALPTEDDCRSAMAMQIETGEKDGVQLDGLTVVVLILAPGAFADGNLTVGLIIDERATDEQTQGIVDIVSGDAGGPMAALAPLVTSMAGVEKRPITFENDGMRLRVKAGELFEQACEGVPSAVAEDEPLYIDNTCHPINKRLALAKATTSHFHAFGIDWDDQTGTRNGHFARFSWSD